jgi:hypothetical protein
MSNWWKKRWAQAITGIYVDRCDPAATVWAQLADAYFLQALISYGEPGWKDTIDLGTGRSWLKHARSKMKEAERETPKWLTETGTFLGETAEWLDKKAWLLMVIETFGGAALQWASAAYQVDPCTTGGDYHWWKSTDPLGFYDNQSGWVEGPIWVAGKGNQGAIRSSELLIPAGWQGYFYAAVNCDKFVGFGGVYGWKTRMVTGEGLVVSENSYTVTPGKPLRGPMDFHWFPVTQADRLLRWEISPDIRGGFTEWYVASGAAGASIYKLGAQDVRTTKGKIPKPWSFKSVLDPEFQ